MRKTRGEMLLDLMRAEEAEARQEQLSFELDDPKRAPEAESTAKERNRARSRLIMMQSEDLIDCIVFISEIADDETKLCRCLNAASCLCIGSNKFRVIRREARALERRLRQNHEMRTTVETLDETRHNLRSVG